MYIYIYIYQYCIFHTTIHMYGGYLELSRMSKGTEPLLVLLYDKAIHTPTRKDDDQISS